MPGKSLDALTVAAGLALAALAAACSPTRTANQGNTEDAPMSAPEKKIIYTTDRAELIDPARQLYRFGDGVCRELSRIPKPWQLVDRERYKTRDPVGYSWAPKDAIGYESVYLEADNTAFGIAPPGRGPSGIQHHGRGQEIIDLNLSPNADEWLERIARTGSVTPSDWNWPARPPFPLSSGFQAYARSQEYVNPEHSLVLISRAQHAAVEYTGGLDLPNPKYQGVVIVGSDEVAAFWINYEGLGKLREIVESVTQLARTIRVDCPQGDNGHG